MLACIRMGAVMIPATTLLTAADVADRVERGEAKAVIAAAADAGRFGPETERLVRLSVGDAPGWLAYEEAIAETSTPLVGGGTAADDPMLLYFTSGTTAQPKLVEHTQTSYPVGHLSTMYWIGLQPRDLHLNISSPGWAEACLVVLLRALERRGDDRDLQLPAVRPRRAARRDGAGRRDDLLRAADRVADDHAGAAWVAAARSARVRRRR